MCRRESNGRHPRLARRLLVDPGDGRVNYLGAAKGPRAEVGRCNLNDRAILAVDHQRRNVMPTERGKIDVAGSRIAAGLIWIEDAAVVAAYAAWRFRPGFGDHFASVVAGIASTRVCPAVARIADEPAGPGARRRHAASRFVDRRGIAGRVQPPIEVIPAQRPHHAIAVRVVALNSHMEFAEQRALVTALLEQ